MDSYKKGNENLINTKTENHLLSLGENFVLSSALTPRYMDVSTEFLTYIK